MPKKVTTTDFINKAISVHGSKYDYSDTIYKKSNEKVKIKCPDHGHFLQFANNHIYNKQGCPKCGNLESISKRKSNKEEFINKAISVHGNRYGYDDVEYVNNYTEVEIKCFVHGNFFQAPNIHLNKSGCPKCANINKNNKLRDTVEEFINKAISVHGDIYGYDDVIYINNESKIKIKCFVHGNFFQTPHNHLHNKTGCPKCANITISKTHFINIANERECTFYIIKCFDSNESFYKIGITSRNLQERFSNTFKMPYEYEIIKEINGSAETIWNIENTLKKNLKSSYTPCISFSGSLNECFTNLKEIENNLKIIAFGG